VDGFLDTGCGKVEMAVGVAAEFSTKKIAFPVDALESLTEHDFGHAPTVKGRGVDEVHS